MSPRPRRPPRRGTRPAHGLHGEVAAEDVVRLPGRTRARGAVLPALVPVAAVVVGDRVVLRHPQNAVARERLDGGHLDRRAEPAPFGTVGDRRGEDVDGIPRVPDEAHSA